MIGQSPPSGYIDNEPVVSEGEPTEQAALTSRQLLLKNSVVANSPGRIVNGNVLKIVGAPISTIPFSRPDHENVKSQQEEL